MEKIKNKKIVIIVLIVIIVVIAMFFIAITIFKNKLTPEETVSKFMYLIENKEYEEAKKLCKNDLDKLEVLSNINPSNLLFEFSDDKEEAIATLLENEIEVTNMKIELKKSLLGWKIEKYDIITDLIDPQTIEDRLKDGKDVTDIQLLYWGESNVSSKDEIAQYIKDNGTVAIIFAESMKDENYDKVNEMYQSDLEKSLTIEQLKEYNWENYEITSNFEMLKGTTGSLNGITIKLDDRNLYIFIAGGKIISITPARI